MIARIQVVLAITDDKDPEFKSPAVVIASTENLNRLVPDQIRQAVEDALQHQAVVMSDMAKSVATKTRS